MGRCARSPGWPRRARRWRREASSVEHGSKEDVVALGVLALDQFFAREAGLAQEARHRLGGCIGARGPCAPRSPPRSIAARRARSAPSGAAWRRSSIAENCRLSLPFSRAANRRRQIGRRLFLHAGGIFRAQLQEEVLAHTVHSGYLAFQAGVMCAIHASGSCPWPGRHAADIGSGPGARRRRSRRGPGAG